MHSMHVHSCVSHKNLIENLLYSIVSLNDKILHKYETRESIKKKMVDEDHRYVRVQGELEVIRGTVAKIMEMVQPMALSKETLTSQALEAHSNAISEPVMVPRPASWP